MASIGLPPDPGGGDSGLLSSHQGRSRSMMLYQMFRSVGAAPAKGSGGGGGDVRVSELSSPTPSARLRERSSNLSDALAMVGMTRQNRILMGGVADEADGPLIHIGQRSGELAAQAGPTRSYRSPFAAASAIGSVASASAAASVPVGQGSSGGAGQQQQQHYAYIGGNGGPATTYVSRAGGGGGGGRNGASSSSGSLHPASSSSQSMAQSYGAAASNGPPPPPSVAAPSSSSGSSTRGGSSTVGARGRRWSVVSGTSLQSSPLSAPQTSGSAALGLGIRGGSSSGGGGGGGGDQPVPTTRTSAASRSSNGSGGFSGGFSGGVNRQNSQSSLASMAAAVVDLVIPTMGSERPAAPGPAAPGPPRSPTHRRQVERVNSGLGLAGLLSAAASTATQPNSADSAATGGGLTLRTSPAERNPGCATISSAAQQLQAYAARRSSLRVGRAQRGGGAVHGAGELRARRSLDDAAQCTMLAVHAAGGTMMPGGLHYEPEDEVSASAMRQRSHPTVRRAATFSVNNQPDGSGEAATVAVARESDIGREFSTASPPPLSPSGGSGGAVMPTMLGTGGTASSGGASAAAGGRAGENRMSAGRVSGRSSANASEGPFFQMMALLREQAQAQARPPH